MKKKINLIAAMHLCISAFLLSSTADCGAQSYLWAKSAGGTASDAGYSVTADASGNIIVTGSFNSSSISFGTDTLTNAGSADILIVKYDGSGNVLWAKSAGGTIYDLGNSVTADASGNIIITGYFSSPSITFGTTTLTNASGYDILIVKYDGSGNVIWAKSAGGTSHDYGNSVTADASGNIMVTGSFNSSSITFGTDTLTNVGSYDILIVKYDSSGNVLWAKREGGNADDYGKSVTADASGNIMVTGFFRSPSITFGTVTLTNSTFDYRADILIVKYDGSGSVPWATSAGGTDYDAGYSISADASGNIIVTGAFTSSSITFGTTTFTNAGSTDIFVVKFNGTTGIEENEQTEGVNIFPNPTTGKFAVAGGSKEIEIYNVQGEKVTRSVIPNGERNLIVDLSNHPNGIYFVHVITAEKQYNRKIVLIK